MLARGAALAFRDRAPERFDEHRPGAPRLDHVVDVAALRGGVRVREPLPVLGDQLGAPRLRIVCLFVVGTAKRELPADAKVLSVKGTEARVEVKETTNILSNYVMKKDGGVWKVDAIVEAP